MLIKKYKFIGDTNLLNWEYGIEVKNGYYYECFIEDETAFIKEDFYIKHNFDLKKESSSELKLEIFNLYFKED